MHIFNIVFPAFLALWCNDFDSSGNNANHDSHEQLGQSWNPVLPGDFPGSKSKDQIPIDIISKTIKNLPIVQNPDKVARNHSNTGIDDKTTVINVDLEGNYSWELLFDIDNRNNSGYFEKTVVYEKSTTESYSNLKQVSLEAAIKAGMSSELSAEFEVFRVSSKMHLDVSVSGAYNTTVQNKTETTFSEKRQDKYQVGPNSRLAVYQLVYHGPGLTYYPGTVSTSPQPLPSVKITCSLRRKSFLKDFQIVYTDRSVNRPPLTVVDNVYQENDINFGFNGEYVWLVPVWTNNTKEAATSFQLAIQAQPSPGHNDLAAGTGGSYRYLLKVMDPRAGTRIDRVGLLRGHEKEGDLYNKRALYGWDECTSDVNKGRGGDYLYICWNNYVIGQ